MTKQQAIRELARRGWTQIEPDGRFCVRATSPTGQRGLYDPRALLAELTCSTEPVARGKRPTGSDPQPSLVRSDG